MRFVPEDKISIGDIYLYIDIDLRYNLFVTGIAGIIKVNSIYYDIYAETEKMDFTWVHNYYSPLDIGTSEVSPFSGYACRRSKFGWGLRSIV